MVSLGKHGLMLCCLLLSTFSWAQDNIEKNRENFVAAEKALRNNHMTEYQSLRAELNNTNYVLKPYLDYAEIQRLLSQGQLPTAQVRAFLTAERDSSLGDRLRSAWLYTLIKKNQWTLFLEDYQPGHDVGLQCNALYARYKVTQDSNVLNQAKPLWLSGTSQPEPCNRLFDTWREQGGIPEALVWDRIRLAMAANQYAIVNYLIRYIPKEKQSLVQTWLTTYKDPKIIASDKLFSGKDPFLREIQVDGLKRVARRDSQAAVNLWSKIEKKYSFSEAQRYEAIRAIATQLAMAHDPGALEWYGLLPIKFYDDTAFEWHVRAALREGHWKEVHAIIAQFPKHLYSQSTWQYWLARAYEETGQTHQALSIYSELAKDRTFAGLLSSDRLGIAYPLDLPLVPVTLQDLDDIQENKGIARALELHELGRLSYASREWIDAVARLDEVQLQAAAILAYERDWQERAILTLSKAKNQNNLVIRFPVLYQKIIEREAKKTGLSPAWLFAIARRESAFVPDIKSPVGATGLMQLMPATAKQVAQNLKEPYQSPAQLTQPALNIRLGSAYLAQVYKSFDNSAVLATAAYNAGPQRVKQWLPKTGEMDSAIWIETIPFYETREYVKAVMIYRMIYQHHFKNGERLVEVL